MTNTLRPAANVDPARVAKLDETFLGESALARARESIAANRPVAPYTLGEGLPDYLRQVTLARPDRLAGGPTVAADLTGLTPAEVVSEYGGAGAKSLHQILEQQERLHWASPARLGAGALRQVGQALGHDKELGQWILPMGDGNPVTLADVERSPGLQREFRNLRRNLPRPLDDLLQDWQQTRQQAWDPRENGVEELQAFRKSRGLSPGQEEVKALNEQTAARASEGGGLPPGARGLGALAEAVSAAAASEAAAPLALGAAVIGAVGLGAIRPNLRKRTGAATQNEEDLFTARVEHEANQEHKVEAPQHYHIVARVRGVIRGNPSPEELVAMLHEAGSRHLDQSAGPAQQTHSVTDHREKVTQAKLDGHLARLMRGG